MSSGQTFENNTKYHKMSQGMVAYLHVAPRRVTNREAKKKLWKEAEKEQKPTELPNTAELLKILYFRQKERWVDPSGNPHLHCPFLGPSFAAVLSDRIDQKAVIVFSGINKKKVLSNNVFCEQLSSSVELKSDSTNYHQKMKAKVHHSGIQLINKVSLRPSAVQRLWEYPFPKITISHLCLFLKLYLNQPLWKFLRCLVMLCLLSNWKKKEYSASGILTETETQGLDCPISGF